MTILALGFIAAFLSGAFVAFVTLMRTVFDANFHLATMRSVEMCAYNEKLTEQIKEFAEITKVASTANNSLVTRVKEYDEKFKDFDSKLNMMGLKVTHR